MYFHLYSPVEDFVVIFSYLKSLNTTKSNFYISCNAKHTIAPTESEGPKHKVHAHAQLSHWNVGEKRKQLRCGDGLRHIRQQLAFASTASRQSNVGIRKEKSIFL